MPTCAVHAEIIAAESPIKNVKVKAAVEMIEPLTLRLQNDLCLRRPEIMDASFAICLPASARRVLLLLHPIHFNSKPSRRSNMKTCW